MNSDIKKLKKIFENMVTDGFDIGKPLKWGFFFFDYDETKLLKVFDELKDNEYFLEGIIKMDDGLWRLFVSKIEILTPEKLHRRNLAFNDLANYYSISLYDGWDVEMVNSNE